MGRSIISFKAERSTTSLAVPSGLGTKNPREHHSEGSLAGTSSKILFLIASLTTVSADFFKWSGG